MSDDRKEHATWWAVCDDCECSISVVRHWGHPDETPEPPEWDDSWDCPVCAGSLMNQWSES